MNNPKLYHDVMVRIYTFFSACAIVHLLSGAGNWTYTKTFTAFFIYILARKGLNLWLSKRRTTSGQQALPKNTASPEKQWTT